MADGNFYSDRAGKAKPRISEEISDEAWAGLTTLIRQRINDGSLARAFPKYDCPDDRTGHSSITGTDEEMFLDALRAHIPQLTEPSAGLDAEQDMDAMGLFDFIPYGSTSRTLTKNPLDPRRTPVTVTALDVVDFVSLYIDQPSGTSYHGWGFAHDHYFFREYSDSPGELTPACVPQLMV